MLRFIQEVNTTTRSCALWDLDEDTEYIVHVQSISMGGSSPPSEPVLFRTPKESEKMASKSPGDRRWLFLVSRQPKIANMKAIYNISHPLTVFFTLYVYIYIIHVQMNTVYMSICVDSSHLPYDMI